EAFLRLKAEPLTASMVDEPEFQVLKERMLATVCDPTNEGVGIAAPQVGISRRLVAVQRFDKEGEPFEFYINPEIVARSEERELGSEGCLSVPEMSGDVWRSTAIRLQYNRESDFSVVEEDIEDFTAVIFQHELDHLDGVLYIDYLEE
ncbi:MAG: peptide deformylase, partial [Tidjanibacter sp.]|nr:peptide deformylase [Tidjanibacter sp.]